MAAAVDYFKVTFRVSPAGCWPVKMGQSSQTLERGMFRIRDTRWRNWLRHCIKNQKVACLFQLLNLSGRIIALGSTKLLTEMSISPGAVKAAGT